MERKHPLAKCEECPLREVGRYVASNGPGKARVAVVGEAPGVQEARKGIPFIGPSGKLLDIVLTHHGIDRSEVFLSNACLCRPPDNSTPARSAILACRPRLIGELQDRGVGTVVALGNSAAESLLGRTGITKLRVGPPKLSQYLPGVRVIPTIHPAAALRQSDQFPHIVTDIGKVNHELPKWDPPQYVVADDDGEALQLLAQLDERLGRPEDIIVVDIEVDIEKDTSFDHPSRYGMLCVGLGYAPGRVLVLSEGVMGSEQVRARLGQLLRKYRIVAQNGKFDLPGLYPLLGALELYGDTMLASYAFDERAGVHGLKYMAVEFLGAPQYDEEIKKYVGPGIGYGAIPRGLLYKYNAYDVACTYAMWDLFQTKFRNGARGQDARRVHNHLVQASNELMYVELNGIAIDRAYNSALNVEYIETLNRIEKEVDDLIKTDYDKRGGINLRSPMQVKKYLADKKIMVDSTNVDTLEHLMDIPRELPVDDKEVRTFVQTLLRHRTEAKAHGTYVKGIAKRLYRGRVYSTFLLHGTTTGRLSSRNPNLQNIPRDSKIRSQFIPAKSEHGFLQVDYSQAELRVLSCLAGDTYFRDIFNAGDRDVFDDLTPILYPKERREDLTPAEWKELRIRVKAFVYGLGYGREAGSIASEYGLSLGEANTLKRNFFEVIPEIVQFQKDTRERVLMGNELITPFGRHRRFMLITDENRHNVMNEALAFLPQSTASDICLRAFIWTRRDLRGIGWIRNLVHDSLLIEAPWERLEECRVIASANMIKSAESIVGDYVKFAVDYKIGKNWGEV